jgi:hypothetical protein
MSVVHNRVRDAVVFDVSNVYRHLAELSEEQRDAVGIAEQPKLVPPFKTTWFEWDTRTAQGSDIAEFYRHHRITRMAILMHVSDLLDHFPSIEEAHASLMETFPKSDYGELGTPARWLVHMWEFHHGPGTVTWPDPTLVPMIRTLMLDGNGASLRKPGTDVMIHATQAIGGYTVADLVKEDPDLAHLNRHVYLTPAMSLAFLHCKNVTVEDATDARTRQQRRFDERRGVAPVTFKTLVIDPSMGRKATPAQRRDAHDPVTRLHICRGHFSTYTEEKPLFGKYAGTFWIPAHVRGSAEVGMVGKDYRVKAGAA